VACSAAHAVALGRSHVTCPLVIQPWRSGGALRKNAGDSEKVSGRGDGAFWWKSKSSFFAIKDRYMVSMFLGEGIANLEAAKTGT